MKEYLDSVHVPDLTDAEEREVDDAGATIHHRFLVPYADYDVDLSASEYSDN